MELRTLCELRIRPVTYDELYKIRRIQMKKVTAAIIIKNIKVLIARRASNEKLVNKRKR